MKFAELMKCVDCEQQMTVCILDGNGTDVASKIIGDQDSICRMISQKYRRADVSSISVRDKKNIWVWVEEDLEDGTSCTDCPYCDDLVAFGDGKSDADLDALSYIQQLESRLAQVERERDALRQCICGATVYKLITTKDGSGSIVEEQLCGFHYIDPPKQRSNKRGNYMIVYHESTGHITHLPVSQIGKTVFFIYEDAKTALDERRGVCEENTKE